MKLKVMAYNVYYGFRSDAETLSLEVGRLGKVKKIVQKENPDVLVLTEAGFGAPNSTGKQFDYQKHFGYEHAVYVPHTPRLGIIVLSKHEIQWSMPLAGTRGTAVHLGIGSFGAIEILAIHPFFDLPDEKKIEWVSELLDNVEAPAIILGDFNALSHRDEYNREKMLEVFEEIIGPGAEQLADTLLDRTFLAHLEERGFQDVLAEHDSRPTIPTKWRDAPQESPLRMDYIMISPDIEVESASVLTGKLADQGSDHYPVVATLKI